MLLPLAHAGNGAFAPLQLLLPVVVAIAYLLRARTLAAEGRPVSWARQLSFVLGAVCLLIALGSPVAHIGEELFLAHMAQHLLMADIGALLIVLGLTGPVLQPVLGVRVVERLRVLAHPVVALPLWALGLYVWHVPVLYQAALGSEAIHALEHFSFVALGINAWLSLFGPLPMPEWFGNGAKLAYIFLMRMVGALLANVLMWSGTVLYPDYGPGVAQWGISLLSDQGTAGVLMMVEGSLLTIVLLGWLFLKTAREAEERQRLLEFAAAHGLELSERRAARAVGAGRGSDLRRRLEHAAGREDTGATATLGRTAVNS